MNVDQTEFMAEVEWHIASAPIADWKIYLRWQVLNSESDLLPQAL